MDKEYLTSGDIAALVKASKSLAPGEIEVGSLGYTTIPQKNGLSKVVTNFIPDVLQSENQTPNITINASISSLTKDETYHLTGEVYSESFKNKPKFSLKRTFFAKLNHLHEKVNLKLLNLGRIIYYYDESGKVYFKDTNNHIYYVNSTKTGCVTPYGEYGKLIPTKEGYDIEFDPDIDTTYFDYLYITPKYAKESEKDTQLPEFNPYQSLFTEEQQPSSKVIDFEAYREKMSHPDFHR